MTREEQRTKQHGAASLDFKPRRDHCTTRPVASSYLTVKRGSSQARTCCRVSSHRDFVSRGGRFQTCTFCHEVLACHVILRFSFFESVSAVNAANVDRPLRCRKNRSLQANSCLLRSVFCITAWLCCFKHSDFPRSAGTFAPHAKIRCVNSPRQAIIHVVGSTFIHQ